MNFDEVLLWSLPVLGDFFFDDKVEETDDDDGDDGDNNNIIFLFVCLFSIPLFPLFCRTVQFWSL